MPLPPTRPYEQRVDGGQHVIRHNARLGKETSADLAVLVLHALNPHPRESSLTAASGGPRPVRAADHQAVTDERTGTNRNLELC